MKTLPEVQEELARIGDDFSRLQHKIGKAAQEYETLHAEATAAVDAYVTEHRKDIAVGIIKSVAATACRRELKAASDAKGRLKLLEWHFKALDKQLETARSQNAALTTEMQLTRTGYGT
jgi:phage shock protein A